MTRVMHLEREYRIIATASLHVNIDHTLIASDYEEAEQKFRELIDDGEFDDIFIEHKPDEHPHIEIDFIESTTTSQER